MNLAYDVGGSSGIFFEKITLYLIPTLLAVLFSSNALLDRIGYTELGLEDFISLSMVAKQLHSHFDPILETFLRDTFGQDKFLSLAKAFLLIHMPATSLSIREKILDFSEKRFPRFEWLAPSGGDVIPPTLRSFWQVPNHFGTNYERQVSSSFRAWVNRHGHDTGRNWIPKESQFQLMVASPYLQVGSSAIVLAAIGNYSDYTFELIRRRIALSDDPYDYQDVVAALGVPSYDPKKLMTVLDAFLVSSDEIFWNLVCRGSSDENDQLLFVFLLKPLASDLGWTFHNPSGSPTTAYLTSTRITSCSTFSKSLIKKAQKNGFPKKLVSRLKRKYKFKI